MALGVFVSVFGSTGSGGTVRGDGPRPPGWTNGGNEPPPDVNDRPDHNVAYDITAFTVSYWRLRLNGPAPRPRRGTLLAL